jgi:hypothetical protein
MHAAFMHTDREIFKKVDFDRRSEHEHAFRLGRHCERSEAIQQGLTCGLGIATSG